jgi:hypothetical protein
MRDLMKPHACVARLLAAGLLAIVACSGSTSPGGGTGASGAGGAPGWTYGGAGGDYPTLADGAPNCAATCTTPAGTVQLLSSFQDVAAALAGRWRICSDGPRPEGVYTNAPFGTIGIDFGPLTDDTVGGARGTWYYLVQGPTGPVRGDGTDYQREFFTSPDGYETQITGDGTRSTTFMRYSACPREIEMTGMGGGPGEAKALLVPFE